MLIKQGMPIIPAHGRLKPKDSKYEANLDYIGNFRFAWTAHSNTLLKLESGDVTQLVDNYLVCVSKTLGLICSCVIW